MSKKGYEIRMISVGNTLWRRKKYWETNLKANILAGLSEKSVNCASFSTGTREHCKWIFDGDNFIIFIIIPQFAIMIMIIILMMIVNNGSKLTMTHCHCGPRQVLRIEKVKSWLPFYLRRQQWRLEFIKLKLKFESYSPFTCNTKYQNFIAAKLKTIPLVKSWI